jgi:hypothetical protein
LTVETNVFHSGIFATRGDCLVSNRILVVVAIYDCGIFILASAQFIQNSLKNTSLQKRQLEIFSCNIWCILEVKICIHDFYKAEIAYCIHGLTLAQGIDVSRLYSGAWFLSCHGVAVHTGCQLSCTLKYKIRAEQQKHGVNDNSRLIKLILSWKPQLILLCCVDTTHTWELRGVANVGAKFNKHTGMDIVPVLDTTMSVMIPELVLSLQGLQGLDFLTAGKPQGVYWMLSCLL